MHFAVLNNRHQKTGMPPTSTIRHGVLSLGLSATDRLATATLIGQRTILAIGYAPISLLTS